MIADVTDLAEFLLARIAEDEAAARAALGDSWEVGPTYGARDNRVYVRRTGDLIDSVGTCVIAGQVSNVPEFRANAAHIARHDPARVLAECEAKRRVIEELVVSVETRTMRDAEPRVLVSYRWPSMLKLLALPYADDPDYREDWRP